MPSLPRLPRQESRFWIRGEGGAARWPGSAMGWGFLPGSA